MAYKSVYAGYSTIEDIYEGVLRGDLLKLPPGTLKDPNMWHRIVVHFFNEILKWDRETICTHFSVELIASYNMRGVLGHVFRDSPFEMLNYMYPSEFMPWELGCTPMGYWTLETAALAVRWLIETKLNWSREEVLHLTVDTFYSNGLTKLIECTSLNFNGSPFKLIDNAYPGEFKPWEFRNVSKGYWDDSDKIYAAVRWLIEQKLFWGIEEIYSNFNHKIFKENGFYFDGFGANSYNALFGAYPGILYPWKFKSVPNGFWTDGFNITWYIYYIAKCEGIDIDTFLLRWRSTKLGQIVRDRNFTEQEIQQFILNAYSDDYHPPY